MAAQTSTPRPILDAGMNAQRWKIVASGEAIETGWIDHGYSKNNRSANRYAALAMYRRRELDAQIRKDIQAFGPAACRAALEVLAKGNPWRPLIERQAEGFTAHQLLADEINVAARAALAIAA